jgi:16S rRNA processing protein RimM
MGPRSTSRSISDDDTLVVAQIRGPHGVRGEVRIDPRSDVEGRFRVGAVLECDGVGPVRVESIRGEKASPIVALEGYRTRDAASTLRDRFLRVSRTEARRATRGSYLWADLVGMAVATPDGRALGVVRDLIRAGGSDVLVIDGEAGELLLPMLDTVVRSVDLDAKRIVATPLEGLG